MARCLKELTHRRTALLSHRYVTAQSDLISRQALAFWEPWLDPWWGTVPLVPQPKPAQAPARPASPPVPSRSLRQRDPFKWIVGAREPNHEIGLVAFPAQPRRAPITGCNLLPRHHGDIPLPASLICAHSLLAEGGTGVFLDSGPVGIQSGGYQVAEYFGDPWIAPEAGEVIDDYVFDINGLLLKAHATSMASLINDNFEQSNCFADITPAGILPGARPRLVIRLIRPVLPDQLFELSFNYGKQYWTDRRLQLLPAATEVRARNHYGLPPRQSSRDVTFTPPSEPVASPIKPPGTEQKATTPTPYGTRSEPPKRALLLGMVYSVIDDPSHGGQCYRDRLRAKAFENLLPGWQATTADDKHVASNPIVHPGRHICANFNAPNRLIKAWRDLHQDEVMDMVILDYVFSPAGWVQTRWSTGLFQLTLPKLADEGLLRRGGCVWLPGSDYVKQSLLKHEDVLSPHYTVLTQARSDNPLFAATATVTAALALDKDPATEEPPAFFYQLVRHEVRPSQRGKRTRVAFLELYPFKKSRALRSAASFSQANRVDRPHTGGRHTKGRPHPDVRTSPEPKGHQDPHPGTAQPSPDSPHPRSILDYFKPLPLHPDSAHFQGNPPSGIG